MTRTAFACSAVMRELPEVAYQFEDSFILDSTAAHTSFDLAPWNDMLPGAIDS